MATVLEPKSASRESEPKSVDLDGFLAQLADLSRRFGIAIGDGAQLYVMETEDYQRAYRTSDESDLSFA
nr:hypothetical protein [Sphingomonas sp.]